MNTEPATETAPALSNRKLVKRCKCKSCGDEFTSERREAEFCGDKCRKAWHNLAMVRGRDLYPLVMTWRDQSAANKGNAREALSAICRLVAEYRAEDEEAGVSGRYDTVQAVKRRLAHIFSVTRLNLGRFGR